MDNYPQNLVVQYLKVSSKFKKFERVVFKRFAPNVSEVLEEFGHLAGKFEEAGIYQYAAMCHLGVAKCEASQGNSVYEVNAYLKAARSFLRAQSSNEMLHLRSNCGEYREGALRCFSHALERTTDDSVMKAAIIREMTPLQTQVDVTSSFASHPHRIYELELAAHASLQRLDFLAALQQLDDIVDNICERKKCDLYDELLARVEVTRLLLLLLLNLPPTHQSPAHIKLIEYYYQLGSFELLDDECFEKRSGSPGAHVTTEIKYALAEVVAAWHDRKQIEFKMHLEQLVIDFKTLNEAQLFITKKLCENIYV